MKAKNYAIFSVLISTLLMCFVDGIISPPYLYKSMIKIVLFLLIAIMLAGFGALAIWIALVFRLE